MSFSGGFRHHQMVWCGGGTLLQGTVTKHLDSSLGVGWISSHLYSFWFCIMQEIYLGE